MRSVLGAALIGQDRRTKLSDTWNVDVLIPCCRYQDVPLFRPVWKLVIAGTAVLMTVLCHCAAARNLWIRNRPLLLRYCVLVGGYLKGKAFPLQAWTGPEGSRKLRLPDFKTIGT